MPSLQPAKEADLASPEIAKWDPELTKRFVGFLRSIANRYFRSEIRDLGRIPAGGALLVSNHSGGPTTTDLPTFAVDFFDRFGYDRPLYTLSHDVLSIGPTKQFLQRIGFIPASRDNAARIGLGRRGDGVPRRGLRRHAADAVAERHRFQRQNRIRPHRHRRRCADRARGVHRRTGDAVLLDARVLPAIDITARFGEEPDVAEVDAYVRKVMQEGLDKLAGQRRFPVFG